MADSHDLVLAGCSPEPLGAYLKALGVLRLVAEQADATASGFWRDDKFILRSKLDKDGLLEFFGERWVPTPVIAPWNGGSGFWPKDNTTGADAIVASSSPRLTPYAAVIAQARDYVAARGWSQRPEGADKLALLQWLRSNLPDRALPWLDAAVVLASRGMLFPPLLGTGGNDGRLDFSNNFQQRVAQLVSGSWGELLSAALFGDPAPSKFQGSIGQFLPAADARTNPWDFVLLIEGAMLFVAATSRRLEQGAQRMSFPFHAKAAGGSPTVTDGDEEDSRNEIWLPLWTQPAGFAEVRRLFAEGRATVCGGEETRSASTALDFARAATSLGVDRGVAEFCRVGFHVRNGLSYFATPLGRVGTLDIGATRLLDDLDAWYDRFRRATRDKSAPARLSLVRRRLEQAMFDALGGGTLAPVMLGLADAERELGRSPSFVAKAFISPAPRLQAAWAPSVSYGSTVEQRLGAALAAKQGMRQRLLPIDASGRFASVETTSCVFLDRPLVENLHALLRREDIDWERGRTSRASIVAERCSLSDIAAFIDARVDDALVERWARAFTLLAEPTPPLSLSPLELPPVAYALLAVVHSRSLGGEVIPRVPSMLSRATSGDAVAATEAAARRLTAAGAQLGFRKLVEPPARTRRIAAALAFPVSSAQQRTLEALFIPAEGRPHPRLQTSQELT